MPKGRIQLRLTEQALENLYQRSADAGLTRQAYIEGWLTDWPEGNDRPAVKAPKPYNKVLGDVADQPVDWIQVSEQLLVAAKEHDRLVIAAIKAVRANDI